MSVSRPNTTVIDAVPSPVVEVIRSTPFTCWIALSIGEVANASTVSGDAPAQVNDRVSCGKVTSGRSSTEMFRHAATPRRATET
jgi:hypothetical protein